MLTQFKFSGIKLLGLREMSCTWFWRSGWWTTKNVWQLQEGIFTSGEWRCVLCCDEVRLNKWNTGNWTLMQRGIWPQRPLCLLLSSIPSCLPPCGKNSHKNPPTFCRNTWPGFPLIPVYTWINPKLTLGTAVYSWPYKFKYKMH